MHKHIATFFLLASILLAGCKNDSPQNGPTVNTPTVSAPSVPKFNRDSAFAYIQRQVDFGPRVPATPTHAECKEWIISKLEAFGAKVTRQEFTTTVYTGAEFPGTNIFAQINPENSQRLLFAAHYDTRHIADSPLSTERQEEPILGADDGGSGVGVLLEVARLIGQDTSLDLGVDILFFDIEDYGETGGDGWALGSRYWASNPTYSGGVKPRYGVLLDMVGAKGARFLKEGYSMQYAPNIVDKVWKLAGFMGYSNYFVNQRGGGVTDDHVAVNQVAKIPMIDIINQSRNGNPSFGPHWHTHNDNMDIIDKATLRAVGKVVLEVIYREDAGVL